MGRYIDNHIHSSLTDGELSPGQIMEEVIERKGRMFSVTDHDNIDSITVLKKFQSDDGIIYLPGVELTTSLIEDEISENKIRIHILGYGINENNDHFNRDLIRKNNELECNNREFIAKFLNEFPFVNPSSFEHFSYNKFGWIKKKLRSTLDFSVFTEDQCKKIQSFFDEEPVIYNNYSYCSPDAINIIHSLGGLAVFAHPYQTNLSNESLEQLTAVLIKSGLDGIETVYSGATTVDIAYAKYLAEKYKLLQSVGSDFHTFAGDNGNRICYGINGNMQVESCTLNEELINMGKILKLSPNKRGENNESE